MTAGPESFGAPPRAASARSPSGTAREELHGELERLAIARTEAEGEAERVALAVREAQERRELLEGELRELRRSHDEAAETARRGAWLIEQRRLHGVGPEDSRRAELTGEIAAERRLAERVERERVERQQRQQRLSELIARDRAIAPEAERLAAAIEESRDRRAGAVATGSSRSSRPTRPWVSRSPPS